MWLKFPRLPIRIFSRVIRVCKVLCYIPIIIIDKVIKLTFYLYSLYVLCRFHFYPINLVLVLLFFCVIFYLLFFLYAICFYAICSSRFSFIFFMNFSTLSSFFCFTSAFQSMDGLSNCIDFCLKISVPF